MLDQTPQRQPGRPIAISHVLAILARCADPAARISTIASFVASNGMVLDEWLVVNALTTGQVRRAPRGDPIVDEAATRIEHYIDAFTELGIACAACEAETGRDGFAIAQAELERQWGVAPANQVIAALRRAVDAATTATNLTNSQRPAGRCVDDMQARIDELLSSPEADQRDEGELNKQASSPSPAEAEMIRRIDRLLRGDDE